MFSEMTVGQKLQAAVICLALGASAYLIFANTRTHFDDTVNSWPSLHQYTMDPKQKYDKVKNPYDTKKDEKLTVLACADGQIDFIEYPNDPERHLKVVYRPDLRQANKVFKYYHDPMLNLADITNPYRHAMAYAVYFKIYRPEEYARMPQATRSVLGQIQPQITQDQLAKEKVVREKQDAAIVVMDSKISAGTFHKDALDALEKTLKEFQANQKDIINDKDKQELARKLLTQAAAYDQLIQKAKGEEIDKYIEAMESILTDAQKESLISVVAKREQKTPPATATGRRGRAGTTAPDRGTPPAGRNGRAAVTGPARGG